MSTSRSTLLRSAALLVAAAFVAGSISVGPAAFAAKRAKKTATVTVTALNAATSNPVVSGTRVTITGKTSANLKGKTVKLQRKVGKKWVEQQARTRVTSTGRFTLATKAAGVDTVRYRVAFTGSKKVRAATSNTRSLTVYRWTYLSRLAPKSERIANTGPVSVNGVSYSNSVLLPRNNVFDGHVAYDTKRKCLTLQMTAGVPDTNPITGRTLMRVSHDGRLVRSQVLSGGNSYRFSQDITDVLELRIDRDYTDEYFHDLALGNARILCRF